MTCTAILFLIVAGVVWTCAVALAAIGGRLRDRRMLGMAIVSASAAVAFVVLALLSEGPR